MISEWQIARGSQRRGRVQRPAYVSINKRGEIAMNGRAFDAIQRPWSVTLLYDPKTHTLGVKFPVARDRHFFMTCLYGRGRRMRIVRANRALKQFGIRVEATLKFYNPPVVIYRDEPMLLLELEHGEADLA
jgi:hypothetical protein